MNLLVTLLVLVAAGKPVPRKQVLFFTKSAGFQHAVIKGEDNAASRILEELGAKNGFDVTHTKDGGVFTPEGLAKYDVLVFYTSGDLTTEGTDKQPPMPAGGKQLLLDTIARGKGFVGIHAAADTFLTPGERFVDAGPDADPYIKMVGGEFIRHGFQQKARIVCASPKFPGCTATAGDFHEEWYSYRHLAKDMQVLQWLATWSVKNTGVDSIYRRPPYPVTWIRAHGKGRVFHTGFGHRDDTWTLPAFQQLLVGGIRWAIGGTAPRPNISVVTPGFAELPPNDVTPAPQAPEE